MAAAKAAPCAGAARPASFADNIRISFDAGAFALPALADQLIQDAVQSAARVNAVRIYVLGHCDDDELSGDKVAACRRLADQRVKATAVALRAHGWTGDIAFVTKETAPVSMLIDGVNSWGQPVAIRRAANRYVQITIFRQQHRHVSRFVTRLEPVRAQQTAVK